VFQITREAFAADRKDPSLSFCLDHALDPSQSDRHGHRSRSLAVDEPVISTSHLDRVPLASCWLISHIALCHMSDHRQCAVIILGRTVKKNRDWKFLSARWER
jgi:hypothetical protein